MSDDGYKKHPKGKHLTGGEKQIVLNVFYKLMQHYPDVAVNDIVKLTAEFTGISDSSVANVRREHKTTGTLTTPCKTRKRTKTEFEEADDYGEVVNESGVVDESGEIEDFREDECKIKLENEVMELEETVKELEIKLKEEIESNASTGLIKPPAAPPKTESAKQFTYKEPKMSVSSIGHPVSPFTQHYKKQAVKRKQTEVITSLKSKVPLSAHNQETLPQPAQVIVKPERNFKHKFFRAKLLPETEEKVHNIMDDFDYYKFE